jgi:hypothetical protein
LELWGLGLRRGLGNVAEAAHDVRRQIDHTGFACDVLFCSLSKFVTNQTGCGSMAISRFPPKAPFLPFSTATDLSNGAAGRAIARAARRSREGDEGIWLVSFMHYDLGYFDLEQETLQPLDNPFGTRVVTHVLGTFRYLCVRAGQSSLVSAVGLEPTTP